MDIRLEQEKDCRRGDGWAVEDLERDLSPKGKEAALGRRRVLRQEQPHAAPELSQEECLFFAGKPSELALYEIFRSRLLAEVGEIRVKVQRTQITFSGKYGFAFVSHPRRKRDRGIVISFGLFHRQESDRIQFASEPYPNRWTHHMPVSSPEEIDGELMGWIREAYWFANTK